MDNYLNFENEILDKLKNSKMIKRFSFSEVKESPNKELVERLFLEPVPIDYDDGGLFFIDENNDKIYCPNMNASISESGEWLSDKIPPVNFDIDQNGNVRKADEAEALFCVCVIGLVLKEKDFRNEVVSLSKSYDFNNMKNISDETLTFRSLLNEWQELQSVIINILISACKFRMSNFKKDIEKFLRDGISSEEAAELRELESKIRSVNFHFSEGILSAERIKSLTKIEKLQQIDERDSEISNLINKSPVGILFKILKLSSEYISPVMKKKISLWVKTEVDKLFESDKNFKNLQEERTMIVSRLQRRALRFEKNSIRRLNVEKYIKDKDNYKLPVKL